MPLKVQTTMPSIAVITLRLGKDTSIANADL
jgi:hypothetical protein